MTFKVSASCASISSDPSAFIAAFKADTAAAWNLNNPVSSQITASDVSISAVTPTCVDASKRRNLLASASTISVAAVVTPSMDAVAASKASALYLSSASNTYASSSSSLSSVGVQSTASTSVTPPVLATSTPAAATPAGPSSSSAGIIGGSVAGGVALLALLVGAAIVAVKRSRSPRASGFLPTQTSNDHTMAAKRVKVSPSSSMEETLPSVTPVTALPSFGPRPGSGAAAQLPGLFLSEGSVAFPRGMDLDLEEIPLNASSPILVEAGEGGMSNLRASVPRISVSGLMVNSRPPTPQAEPAFLDNPTDPDSQELYPVPLGRETRPSTGGSRRVPRVQEGTQEGTGGSKRLMAESSRISLRSAGGVRLEDEDKEEWTPKATSVAWREL